MVLVQQMTKKSGTISIVKDLSQHFIDRLLTLTEDFDEVILVFDTYKAKSLKQKTREKRRQGKDPIQYQIADDTSIKQIPMGRFLSHEKTKADLAKYLAEAVLKKNANAPKKHEDADTLMMSILNVYTYRLWCGPKPQ